MRYGAFISYNHRDRKWATWLHRALETYRVPARLRGRPSPLGPIGARLPPIFRDRDELAAAADLAKAVRDALDEAATLVVLCSPAGARSKWVNEEIRYFRALGRGDRIRCVIVAGEPHAADPAEECLPPALLEDGDSEPLAADTRKGQDGKAGARLKLIASMLAVPYDELRQREAQRRQRRLAIFATASTIGLVGALALALFAFLSRAEAVRQRNIAEQRTRTAERTVGFVKSLFEVSDPSEARGRSVTAREIVDRGATQVKTALRDEPAVRTELAVTLSEVYGALGLYREADRLARWTWRIPHGQPDIRARQLLALGDARRHLADYPAALKAYRRAIALTRGAEQARTALLPRMLAGLGEAQSAEGDYPAAGRSIGEALRLDLAAHGPDHKDVAQDREALGINLYYAGDDAGAERLIRQALATRRRLEGPLSPSVSDNITTLGAIAYGRGDLAGAERLLRSRFAIDERVLGRDHPDIATSLNNLGRVMLERRAFAAATPLLERAVAIDLRERGEMHDEMAFLFANLAIAYRHLNREADAERLFERALAPARRHRHRNLAPILTDLAELHCAGGRTLEGLRLLDEARPIMAETYPDDPWRVAWADAVRATCLVRAGHTIDARPLFARSAAAIRERWPAGTLYRDDLDRLPREEPVR